MFWIFVHTLQKTLKIKVLLVFYTMTSKIIMIAILRFGKMIILLLWNVLNTHSHLELDLGVSQCPILRFQNNKTFSSVLFGILEECGELDKGSSNIAQSGFEPGVNLPPQSPECKCSSAFLDTNCPIFPFKTDFIKLQ